MLKADVNEGQFNFELNPDDMNDWDIIDLGDGKFHLLIENRSYSAQIIESDPSGKILSVKVGQNVYQVKLEDENDQLIRKMGLSNLNTKKINQVKAPMPGLVLDILIEPGQSISKGDSLIILEAMKMENVLKAPSDGVVKAVLVDKGASVEKNTVLIDLE
ncbi:MAG: biotin/lipoyl-containing protein [Bacteroidota bacterium]